MEQRWEGLGIRPCDILLPHTDLNRWAVVACDQYTSQPEYWDAVEKTAGDAPSALRMMVPEIYLGTARGETMQREAAGNMRAYLENDLFTCLSGSMLYLERATPYAPMRRGLMAAMDLEQYDYTPGSQSLIRATEGTILERLPPRMAVRREAVLEMPHIMVLIDDPDGTVIEPLGQRRDALERVYDFDLMMASGHLTGYAVRDEKSFDAIAAALGVLKAKGGMLYAMGDGNHSLAAAKACWEEIKAGLTPAQRAAHPARYALVELVNVHDEGLHFHPIHRVLFHAPENFKELLCRAMGAREGAGGAQTFTCLSGETQSVLSVDAPENPIDAGTLQRALDDLMRQYPQMRIDYVHGEETVRELARQADTVGILLPAMDKFTLFPAVERLGALPRKTFSMGEAPEKRFYLECRVIRP
ncbi:MAG: DUF1015 domain-containing protein [Eubacteriales bacterium]|nr:DUF1015 domain-containing protein [Eubacteriales bacterium]